MRMLTAREKITRAIVQLQRSQPFFSYITMHLKFHEATAHPSIGVDHKGNTYYNPEFIDTLAPEEVEGVIIHEALHVGLCHMLRAKKRDKRLFNVATDMVVNDILLTAGMRLPKDGILPKYHEYTATLNGIDVRITRVNQKSAEEVYMELAAALEDAPKNPEAEPPRLDEHIYIGEERHEASMVEAECKQMMVEARNYAIGRGMLPAGIERIVDKLLPSKLDWRQAVRAAVTNAMPSDYTYSRPHRKSIAAGAYLPTIVRESCDVVVAVDTSGSISKSMLTEFVSEVAGLGRSYRGLTMTLLCHDTKVHEAITIDPYGGLDDWKPKGGGGTSHKDVWRWVDENKPNNRLIVCLTDGYTEFGNPPGYDVLWVLSPRSLDPGQIPFGRTIKIPEDS